MTAQPVIASVVLSDDQALALAQFVKRVRWTEVRQNAVGDDEADIKQGKVSVNSPIARALIGKESGDVAEVQAPGGLREYEVLDVEYR